MIIKCSYLGPDRAGHDGVGCELHHLQGEGPPVPPLSDILIFSLKIREAKI